jgi:hypothetical protein
MGGISMKCAIVFTALGLFTMMLVGCGGKIGNSASTPADNWQFLLTPDSSAVPLANDIEAILHLTSSQILGTAHIIAAGYVGSDPCYDLSQDIPLTGSIDSQGNIKVTSSSVNGQVLAFTGVLASDRASVSLGNYTFKGGCADGHSGLLTGIKFKPLVGVYAGTLDPGRNNVAVSANLTQSSGATGSFQVNGTVTYTSPTCSEEFTITKSFLAGRVIDLSLTAKDGLTTFVYGNVDSLASQIALADVDGTCGGGGYGTLILER